MASDPARWRAAIPACTPRATYRLQLGPTFTFDDACEVVPYLASLGVSHLYLSPILQAAPGSTHGYDVIDHRRISKELGGEAGFDRLAKEAKSHDLGLIVDVVPNHMALPAQASTNTALWSVLREGPASPFASWFDIDWDDDGVSSSLADHERGEGALLMPILGDRIGTVLASGELRIVPAGVTGNTHDQTVLKYFDAELPVRAGTEHLPLAELLERQWYRLAYWRVADEELNYRRFFDIDTLAALRVENPPVFTATHEVLISLGHKGQVSGFRVDHVDGLADPRAYLRQLRAHMPDAWIVVEKILGEHETLPSDWACNGTTGYEALTRIDGLFLHPAGAAPLLAAWREFTDDHEDFASVASAAKREALTTVLYAEVARLTDTIVRICRNDIRLRDHTRRAIFDVVTEVLVAFDRYRAYIVPGETADPASVDIVGQAAERARQHLDPDRHATLDLVHDLLLGREAGTAGRIDERYRTDLMTRFQQTCGPVMAKGVEDTAFYRWHRFAPANEVGAEPGTLGFSPSAFHAWCHQQLQQWPSSMTTLSTHDTKRSADTRAALAGLTEEPERWVTRVRQWRALTLCHRPPLLDAPTEYLLWQTLVGTWTDSGPIDGERLSAYARKCVRESGAHTQWAHVNEDYEIAVEAWVQIILSHEELLADVADYVESLAVATRAATLGMAAVHLLMPGVPDIYQGCETISKTLVDPDNRQPVSFPALHDFLTSLQSNTSARLTTLAAEKLAIVHHALHLRAAHPESFVSAAATYVPIATTTDHAFAFGRGTTDQGLSVICATTRLPLTLATFGGWGEHYLALPEGRWRNDLSDQSWSGQVPLRLLFEHLPVAVLRRVDSHSEATV